MASPSMLGLLGVGGPRSAAWTPASPPGCRLWLRADFGLWQDAAGTLPAVAHGDVIGRWSDLSGQGNHATQPGLTRPTLATMQLHGLPMVKPDGVASGLRLTSEIALSSEASLYMVGLHDPSAGHTWVLPCQVGTANSYWGYLWTTFFFAQTEVPYNLSVPWSGSGAFVMRTRRTADSAILMAATAVAETQIGTMPGTFRFNALFHREGVYNNTADEPAGEIILYDRWLTSEEDASVLGWLTARWGVAL